MMHKNTRWVVLALVFAAAILNYVDRQIIALLKPALEAEFGWSDRDYGHMASAFQFAAAAAYLGAGWFIDRIGLRTRIVLSNVLDCRCGLPPGGRKPGADALRGQPRAPYQPVSPVRHAK